MFIKNCENFLINLNVINSSTSVKHIARCLTATTISVKSQFVILFKFCEKIDLFSECDFLFKAQNLNQLN